MGINIKQIAENSILFPTGIKWNYSEPVTQEQIFSELRTLNDYGRYCYTGGLAVGILVSLGATAVIYKLTHKKENNSGVKM